MAGRKNPTLALNIRFDNSGWRRVPGLSARLNKAARATQAHLPKKLRLPCEVTVLLTGDAAMRRLNRDFRGRDKPTNVLSFPQASPRQLTIIGKNRGSFYAGDIALGYQYIVSECRRDHKILINHAMHLLIHGILHIFGYDHQSVAGAARMQRLEKKIMTGLGLPNPYAPQPRS